MENVNALHEEGTSVSNTKYGELQRKLTKASSEWNLAILYRDDDALSAEKFRNDKRISPTSRTMRVYDGDLHGDSAPKVVFFCCKTKTDGSLPPTSQYPAGFKGGKTRTVIPAQHILNDEGLCMFFVNYTQLDHGGYSTAQVHVLFVHNAHENIEYCRAKFVELDQNDNGILERRENDWHHRRFLSRETENNVVLYINVCYAHEVFFAQSVERQHEENTKKANFPPYYLQLS